MFIHYFKYNRYMKKIIKNYPEVRWIAHRGLSSKYLENTAKAYKAAAKLPFFGIETDIHLTLDNIPITHHDHNLVRLSNNTSHLKDLSYNDLKSIKLKEKYSIPTLKEYLKIVKLNHKVAVIEFKPTFTSHQIELIFDHITSYINLNHVMIISFHLENLIKIRQKYPDMMLQYLTDKFDKDTLKQLKMQQIDYSIHHSVLNHKIIQTIHQAGLRVATWTVNYLEDAIKLIEMGVDYITTDGIS